MDKALLVISALIISAIAGFLWYMLRLPSLLEIPTRLLRESQRKLDQPNRSAEEREVQGALLAGALMAGSLLIGWIVALVSGNGFLTLAMLSIALPVGNSWARAGAIKKQLQIGNLPAAREQLKGVMRHHAVLDSASVARAAIEYLAVQFFSKIIPAIFWFFVFGVGGMLASFANGLLLKTLASGGKSPTPFGRAASHIDKIFNYIPARLAAFLWLLAILFLANNKWQETAEKISAQILTIPPTRLALLTAASCLNLTLGGASSGYYNSEWVGNGKIEPTTADITRCQYLYMIATSLLFVMLGFFI